MYLFDIMKPNLQEVVYIRRVHGVPKIVCVLLTYLSIYLCPIFQFFVSLFILGRKGLKR